MTPPVCVVVASYNYGRYIAAALDSLRAQTMPDFQAVIVDDGSSDNSILVIERYVDDPRFVLLRQDHEGQARAKNRGVLYGLEFPEIRFIAFLDADDTWHPQKLEKQLALFDRDPELGVVFSRRRLIDPDGRHIRTDNRPFPRGWVLDEMFRDNFVGFSSAVVRREVFEHVGLFDERLELAIDYDLWLRVARYYPFDYVAEPLVDYRTGHANLSTRTSERLETALMIMTRFSEQLDQPAVLESPSRRNAYAETYRHLAVVGRGKSLSSALKWLRRSIAVEPFDWRTWRVLLSTLMPLSFRQWARRLLGRPDWENRSRVHGEK